MIKPADMIKNAFSLNLVSIISYKFWLVLFLFCFYFDLISIKYPDLITLNWEIIEFEKIFWIILATGVGLGIFYIVYTFITYIVISIQYYLPEKENKSDDYKNSNKILDSHLEEYAILLNRSDLMDIYKSYKREKERDSAIRFLNFVLLGFIILNVKFNGIIGKLISESLIETGYSLVNVVHIMLYMFIGFLAVINILNRIKYDFSSFMNLDNKIQDQLKFEVGKQKVSNKKENNIRI